MTDPLNQLRLSIVQREPVIIGFVVGFLAVQLHNAVVTHFHWFTQGQWDSTSQYTSVILTGVITAAIALLVRMLTAPWKKVQAILNPPAAPKHAVALMPAESVPVLVAPAGSLPALVQPLPPV